jgi:hypothetical protein
MQPRGPALRLPYLRARLFQRLPVEVVPLQQLPLLLWELLDRRPHPLLQLLHLQPLISWQRLVHVPRRIRPFQAGGDHHRQARHRIGDVTDIIVKRAPAVASSLLAVRQISKVGGRALTHEGRARIRPSQDAHLPQAVEDSTFDAVVGKSKEVRTYFGIKAVRGLEQADLAIGHQLFEFELGAELFSDSRRQRPHVGAVFFEDGLLIFTETQTPLTRPSTTAAREPG